MSTDDGQLDGVSSPKSPLTAIQALKARLLAVESGPIAIVGAGLRLPGGVSSIDGYWSLLSEGRDAVRPVPSDRWDADAWTDPDPDAPGKMRTRNAGFLDDIATFDAGFFGISPREALELDPAQRLLLEVAWEALESAAIAPDRLDRSPTGVYVGLGLSDYGRRHFLGPDPTRMTAYSGTGSFLSVAAGRISYTLGLQGPSMTVDTACSASLVAVHLAVDALRRGEIDLALAGGANVICSPEPSVYFSKLQATSPDGRCKTFDAAADGYGRGEGAAVVALKRLSDAVAAGDPILAVIRGTAVNHDGRSNGLTAPNGAAQQAVVRAALANAGVSPEQVGYIEAHGTGTPLGDPIEIDALRAVFGARPASRPLRIGSVKTNLGHLETAAGVTGLLKLALCVQRGAVPPHLHLSRINPRIRLDGLEIPTRMAAWTDEVRIGGVSAFGLSGTNAHLVVEQAPPVAEPGQVEARPIELVTLSARTEPALAALAERWAAALPAHPLPDAARTAAMGRAQLPSRVAVVARDAREAADRLAAFAHGEPADGVVRGQAKGSLAPPVVFLFTGQGAQHVGMGRRLYEAEPAFRDALDRCFDAIDPLIERSLRDVMWSEGAPIDQTRWTQPALFALEVALGRFWGSLGVEPEAMLGHSVGEIVAAHLAGVLSLEDAALLVVERGRMMQALPAGGAMASIAAPEAEVAAAIDDRRDAIDIAAVNGPAETVISGVADEVQSVAAQFEARGVRVRRLSVSHAFHSPLMEPMLDGFEELARTLTWNEPKIPVISNLDGKPAGRRLQDPRYWRQHVRRAVRFADGLRTLVDDGLSLFLELGPRAVLSGAGARAIPEPGAARFVSTLHPDRDDQEQVTAAIGALWAMGVQVDLGARSGPGPRAPMPTMAWQGDRYWLEVAPATAVAPTAAPPPWFEIAWRPSPAPRRRARGRWRVVGSADLAAVLEARGATLVEANEEHLVVAADAGSATEIATSTIGAVSDGLRTGARVHLVGRTDRCPASAALRGIGRTLAVEAPDRWGGFVDWHEGSIDAVADAVLADDGEDTARVDAGGRSVARLVRSSADVAPAAVPEGAVLVTGGFGALGRAVARSLADRGAKRLVLAGRTGAASPQAKELIAELEGRGVSVEARKADLGSRRSLKALLGKIDGLVGVVHAAGTTDDALLRDLDPSRIEAVVGPKADGAAWLDELTADRDLALFVLVSSVSGWTGVPGQAAYAAANAVLDAVATARRARGQAAVSLALGPIDGVGLAGELPPEVRARWATDGVRPTPLPVALDAIARATGGAPLVCVAPFDWDTWSSRHPSRLASELSLDAARATSPRAPVTTALVDALHNAPAGARRAMLLDHVQLTVSKVLGMPPERRIGVEDGFFDAGMDSLMAMDLRDRLQSAVGQPLPATLVFDQPTVRALADALLSTLALDVVESGPADPPPPSRAATGDAEPVAIVGIACRMPGHADDLDALWAVHRDRIDTITRVPRDRYDADRYYDPTPGTPGRLYVREGGFVDDIDEFEPGAFGISPREAMSLDPQQRMLLECSWHALEDATIPADRLRGRPVGVYVGIGPAEYWSRFDPTIDDVDAYAGTGNETSFAAGRVSYVLGLQGPSMSVNTACSSSLVATHLAVQALRRGECELALAGGVNAIVGPENTIWMSMLQALAPDARCKAFDERADGYVRAEGCGVLVLKRLSDAVRDGDRIHAVIRGTAVDHDGASSGLTVPNGLAQQRVIRDALADAGVDAQSIGYVECHGTGTRIGDPIEVEALGTVLATGRPADRPLWLGAAKANHGHLEAGAGIAGMLRAILALQHRTVPPIAHLRTPNPALPLDRFPAVRLPTSAEPWEAEGLRRAGVSSFGISGTNAHVVLEESPPASPTTAHASARPTTLVAVSGRSEGQVRALAAELAAADVALADLAFTMNTGRSHGPVRAAVVADDTKQARAGLRAIADGSAPVVTSSGAPRVVFLCTGAGPQAFGMARALAEVDPVFRNALHAAAAAADPHLDRPLLDVIYPTSPQDEAGSPLHDLAYTQPAMFAVEWATAALWRSWGIEPAAVIGHSTGQYVAATLAGVFDLQVGMALMAQRARLMSDQPKIGAMVACFAPEARIAPYLRGHEQDVSFAAVNGPAEVVLSGRAEVVEALAGRIEADGVEIRRLNISHAAHSPLMDPILDRFERLVGEVPLSRPVLPLVENVSGDVAGNDVISPRYWREHMRAPVQFFAGMRTLCDQGYRVFLEIGNHPVLAGAGARCVEDLDDAVFLPSMRRDRPDWEQMLDTAGALHRLGATIDWRALHGLEDAAGADGSPTGNRVVLPVTPFQRKRYWVDRRERTSSRLVGQDWTIAPSWQPVRPNVDPFGSRGDRPLLVLADERGLGRALAARQHRRAVVVRPGAGYALDGDRATVDPADPAQLERLVREVAPAHVVHLWALDAEPIDDSAMDVALPALRSAAFALRAAQAVGGVDTVWLVTRGAASVDGEAPALGQAPMLGLGNVAAVEMPGVGVVRVDLDPSDPSIDDEVGHLELVLNTGLREEQLAIRGGRHFAMRLVRVPALGTKPPPIREDGTYLVTGGLGAIGLQVARWLVARGAGRVVLTSRRERPELADTIERLGDRVAVVVADVSDSGAVDRLLTEVARRRMPPVRGVFHAAGTLDDGWIADLGPERWAEVLRPKLDGTVALQRALPDAELFVLFSSAASLVGNPGQANYAAANAFLDAVAQARRAVGRHAVSLCWGPWAEAGLASEASRQWERSGVRPLPPSLAIEVLEQRLGGPEPVVGVLDLDWRRWAEAVPRAPASASELVKAATPGVSSGPSVEPAGARRSALDELREAPAHRRREQLAAVVTREAAAILGQEPAALNPRVGFFDSGMDSLMAVELAKRLRSRFERSLPATIAFDQPTVEALTGWLYTELGLDRAAVDAAPTPPVGTVDRRIDLDAPIAIVGMSCRMPGGANDPESFWALLRSGRDPMREVPPERWDIGAFFDATPGTRGKMYVREAGWVDQPLVEGFDPEFFGISGREAEILDPQQRMLLEVSYEALERAGLSTSRLEHSRTGVFVGVGSSGWLQRFQEPGGPLYNDQYAGTGSLEAFVSGRVAFALGLHGPNLALNTACSSSLVAIHLACQALRAGEAEQALAGGVHLMLSPENFVYVSQIRALAADGRCKTFDAAADGYGRAEGCGMLVLKRLDDAQRDGDPVLAVIRGTAVGHDGPSSGLTVPYGPAQVQVLSAALTRSGLDPLDVSYLEAHGTGTVLGDPIEIHAAEEVYCRGRTAENPLHIGAVKSNIGHLEVAAGAASVIKMVLALQHREIPPHLHFHRANPDLDLDANHMVVDTAPTPWTSPRGPLRCGVSAFGLAGTNVHLVLEQAPPAAPAPDAPPAVADRPVHLLPLSARSAEALRDLARRTSDELAEGADTGAHLADVAFSAATTRIPYEHRLAVAAPDARTAVERLRAFAEHGEAPFVEVAHTAGRPRVAFLFSGQGAQYPGMGRAVYETWPVFRDVVDRCAAVLDPLLARPIVDVMFFDADVDTAQVHDTAYTQPALFVLEVALAALWRSWGVVPDAVLGHSIGQIAAATVAGVMSLEDGARLVAERGRLMSSLPRDGAMAAVFADEAAVRAAIVAHADDVAIAAVNNPGEVTISGRTAAVDAVLARLAADGVQGRRLVVSHAFHSPLMTPILDAFREVAARVTLHPPTVPVVCNRTGQWATNADLCDPAYWRDLIREPVRFADGLQTLGDDGCTVFVEVGPHTALLGMGRRTLLDRTLAWVPSMQRGESALDRLVPAVGAVWCRGVEIDWAGWEAPWPRERVALPTYPWQRRRVWPELPEFPGRQLPGSDWLVVWSYEDRAPAVGAVGGPWRVIGAGALADRVRSALMARGARLVEAVEAGDVLAGVVVVPAVPDGLGADPTAPAVQLLEAIQPLAGSAPLTVVTAGAQSGADDREMRPLGGSVWGLARVIRAERPELQTVLIDVDGHSDDTALVDAIAATDREPEVVVRAGRRQVGRLVRSGFTGATPALEGGTVLVTGGLAGLGLEAAAWLAGHGAKHLVLTGRSAPSADAEARIAAMRRGGTAVVVERGDVSSAADVERIVAAIAARGETLTGVVHAAGVLADASLARLDAAAFRKTFAPKVHGTWNLHRATEDLPLQFFVMFAAGAGLMGAPGQGNYAAANAFQDAFAHWRRATGRPTTAIDWGTWAEVGMAARVGGLVERQAAEGMRPIPLDTGLQVLGRLLGHGAAQVGVLNVDWDKLVDVVHRGVCPPVLERLVASGPSHERARGSRSAADARTATSPPGDGLRAVLDGRPRETWDEAIEAVVHDAAVRILRLPRDRVLDRTTPLLDQGLDSLTAVELKNRIMDEGVDIPVARVMTGPSIRQIAIMVRQVLDTDAEHAGAGPGSPLSGAGPGSPLSGPGGSVRRASDDGAFSPVTTHLMAFGFGFVLMIAVVVAYWGSTQIFEPRTNLDDTVQPAAEAPADPPAGKAKQGKRKAKAE